MTYQPGIPTGTVPLNQDYLNLQGNFTSLNTQWLVDHVPLTSTSGNPPNGYHQAIHLVPVSDTTSNPPNNQPINGYTATAGYGQLLSAQINDGINTDEALFFLSGGNRLMQMTRNFLPVVGPVNGTTFIPGGFILKFGKVSSTTSGTVNLNTNSISFPNNCFCVWTQPFYTGAAPNSGAEIAVKLTSPSSFDWNFFTGSSAYNGFFWWAIGN